MYPARTPRFEQEPWFVPNRFDDLTETSQRDGALLTDDFDRCIKLYRDHASQGRNAHPSNTVTVTPKFDAQKGQLRAQIGTSTGRKDFFSSKASSFLVQFYHQSNSF